MEITVIDVSKPTIKTKGKSKWNEIVLKYNSDRGEKDRKFVSFDDAYKVVQDLEVGATYDIAMEKDGDHYKWVGAQKIEKASQAAPQRPTVASSGNGWVDRTALDRERFEFDKEKQILIIRQSMTDVAQRIAASAKGYTVQDVKIIAAELVDFVLTGKIVIDDQQEQEEVEHDKEPDIA